ncbi:MAG: AraC family transcriptional regulator, partial [Ruminiclostridium sp.]|nr:AraC family transcriptional regulator [Ruminiclostridium sp.]
MYPIEAYRPITAAPFRRNISYCEIPPCAALRPYIRCFWGTDGARGSAGDNSVVIPDTCMDIIFSEKNDSPCFCGMDERASASDNDLTVFGSVFGIRFYGWTAVLFSDPDLSRTKNRALPAEEYFGKPIRELRGRILDVPTLRERAALAERTLLEMLKPDRENADFMNAVFYLLKTSGRAKISELSRYAAVSEKTLERLFRSHAGLSPKSFASLLRYQLLWREVLLAPAFHVFDAVEKFGYTDQAHLLND